MKEGEMPAGNICIAGVNWVEENGSVPHVKFEKSASFLPPRSFYLIRWCSPFASPCKVKNSVKRLMMITV